MVKALSKEGASLSLYDPAGLANAREELGEDVVYYAQSAVDCLRDADLCIMATPWEEFNELTPEDFTGNMNSPVLLDCWRQLRRPEFTETLDYIAIGLNMLNE
jgi:UDPglucose 6-dehydrogenase